MSIRNCDKRLQQTMHQFEDKFMDMEAKRMRTDGDGEGKRGKWNEGKE